jgi:trans-aconitate 2-methyltransferase
MWDPAQYLKFSGERGRPWADLLARVHCENPAYIADLGCGAGNVTRTLAERWPGARIVGVDSSTEMLDRAKMHAIAGRLEFVQADIANFNPENRLDLLVSNAALHWLPHHERMLARLVTLLAPRGTLAVQMPYHFQNPAHVIVEEMKEDPRWSGCLRGVGLHQQSVMPPLWYVQRLLELGLAVDAWQTTYLHVLTGENPVLEFLKGSALRPLLLALEPQSQAAFLEELARRLRAAYPAHGAVTVMPYPRLFFVAQAA